jgi:WD40 repeat protein
MNESDIQAVAWNTFPGKHTQMAVACSNEDPMYHAVKVIDVPTRKCVAQFDKIRSEVTKLAWNPCQSSSMLAAGQHCFGFKLYDINVKRSELTNVLHRCNFTVMEWSADGKTLAFGGASVSPFATILFFY